MDNNKLSKLRDVYLKADEPIAKFIAKIDFLAERYKHEKYADAWLVDKELLIAVRDALEQGKLF